MAWLHAERFPWSGLRRGIPFATGSRGFPETPLDVTMQGLFYQTSTAVFRSSSFFNGLLAAEHRPLYRKHLEKFDVQFRKLVRCIVGPPPGTAWSAQWHDFLHEWNMRVDHWSHASGILLGQRNAWLNTRITLLTLQICLPNAG